MQKRIKKFSDFWPYYLREHSKPLTRSLHYLGTSIGLILIVTGILHNILFLFLSPIATYGFAWYSHFFVEKNKPATFTYPLWSIIGDLKMFFLWGSGKLNTHLIKAGIKDKL
ncbi:MAG: DUF962 domain-containing protein [Pseudomonadota bacterium]|nr:DUF962 domain-containing protein [Pseudomonadota bacterium]